MEDTDLSQVARTHTHVAAVANYPCDSPEIAHNVTSLASLKQYHRIGRLTLTPTINGSMSYEDYSDLMKNVSFWEQVQGGCFAIGVVVVVVVVC